MLEDIFAFGAAALEVGDLAAAERFFSEVVSVDPRAHAAWNGLSLVAVRSGQADVAVERALRALQHDRRNPVYLNSLAVAYGELGKLSDAEETLRRALKARPAYPEGVYNLGKVLLKQGRDGESLKAFERTYAMDSSFPGAREFLAMLYRRFGRPTESLKVLRAGGGFAEGDAPMIAECMIDAHSFDAGYGWLKDVIRLHPEWASSRFELGLLCLGEGKWAEGWHNYVWRRRVWWGEEFPQTAPLPQELSGKRVLLRGEQGLGDVLLFLRFAGALKTRGAEVGITCDTRLFPLFASVSFVDRLEPQAPVKEAYDQAILVGDLPLALGAEIAPPPVPLRPDAQTVIRVAHELRELGPPPYLGVTWRAGTDVLRGPEYGNWLLSLMKEVPRKALGAALRGWKGTVLSLQRTPYEGEVHDVAEAIGAPVHDVGEKSEDLSELLALLSLLDEYVAVSSTNIHMLAGLGKTARVLVPHPAEWRWMRTGPSAWFPDFPVYRQAANSQWTQALSQLRADLLGDAR